MSVYYLGVFTRFRASAFSHMVWKYFFKDEREGRLIGAESDEPESHKLRVEHEERLDFPGKKLSFTLCKNRCIGKEGGITSQDHRNNKDSQSRLLKWGMCQHQPGLFIIIFLF